MNRRSFVASLAGAVLSVAMNVLPAFGYETEIEERFEEMVLIVEEVDYVRKIVTLRTTDGRILMQGPAGRERMVETLWVKGPW